MKRLNNKHKYNELGKIEKLVKSLTAENDITKTKADILSDLVKEKNNRLYETNKHIAENKNTLDYINQRITYLTKVIEQNKRDSAKKSDMIYYLRAFIIFLVCAGIAFLVYSVNKKMPEIKKSVNKTYSSFTNIFNRANNKNINNGSASSGKSKNLNTKIKETNGNLSKLSFKNLDKLLSNDLNLF